MREEFLEPLPEVRKKATLLMGKVPVPCFVVNATMCEFRVAVPGIEHYEGDPRLTLLLAKGAIPVRIIRQEAHPGGFSFRLQRLDLLEQAVPVKPLAMRTAILSSPLRATCVLALILASCICFPTVSDEVRLLRMQGRRSQTAGWGSSVSKNDSVPATAPPSERFAWNNRSSAIDDDGYDETSSVTVSMISNATRRMPMLSLESVDAAFLPSAVNRDPSTAKKSTTTVQRAALLKSTLEAGQSGGIQNLSRRLAPWLLESAPVDRLPQMCISDAAIVDLKRFESGLRELSPKTVRDVISSLNRTLISASTDIGQAKRVAGLTDYVVMSSDDASLYFRIVQGRTELVRVLPIDFNRTE